MTALQHHATRPGTGLGSRATLFLGLGATLGLGLLLAVAPAAAQALPGDSDAAQRADEQSGAADGWNSAAALRLIDLATRARTAAGADSLLRRFRARAEGHVYFLGDFQGNRHVVRADQVALDVRWQAPDRSLQRMVGRRHEIRLPTRIVYHADHLFLILDNFGDRIHVGEGHEIAGVLHPAAPGARSTYDYRLADSLAVRVGPGDGRVVRVLELEVRPRLAAEPALVGSMFLERETGAIVRLRGTFTPSAYLDARLVRLALDLRSALWEGRHWLPLEQEIEIVRALPWFDLPMQAVIRTRMRVLDYAINEPGARSLGPGQVTYAGPATELAEFDAWDAPLYPDSLGDAAGGDDQAGGLTAEGLLTEAGFGGGGFDAVLSHARELLGRRTLLGGHRLQFALPSASAGLRGRRAEGLLVGAGATYRLDDLTRLTVWGGYPTADTRPQARLALRRGIGRFHLSAEAQLRNSRDIGPAAAAGALQTLSLLTGGDDYRDPWFATGARLSITAHPGAARWELGGTIERHEAARLAVPTAPFGETPLRPVRPIDEGSFATLDTRLNVSLGRALGGLWRLRLDAEATTANLDGASDHPHSGRSVATRCASTGGVPSCTANSGDVRARDDLTGAVVVAGDRADRYATARSDGNGRLAGPQHFTRAHLRLRGTRVSPDGVWAWATDLSFGIAGGDVPAQRLFLLGGRGTLPGHPFRSWGGDRVALWRSELSRVLGSPAWRLRAFAAVGWTGTSAAGEKTAQRLGVSSTPGLRASAGLGIGAFHDIIRFNLAHGFGHGWTVLLSTDPRWWPLL